MAKRATLNVNMDLFAPMITKLDELGGNVKEIVTDALEQAAETIEWDTVDAVKDSNLPAKGKYSKKATENSIVRDSKVEWSGTYASINVGFDYQKEGAGGYLITGRPDMPPDMELNKMYKGKRYRKLLENDIKEIINDAIMEKMGGD